MRLNLCCIAEGYVSDSYTLPASGHAPEEAEAFYTQRFKYSATFFVFICFIFSTWEPACSAIVHPSCRPLPPGSHSAAHEVGKTLIFYTEVNAPYGLNRLLLKWYCAQFAGSIIHIACSLKGLSTTLVISAGCLVLFSFNPIGTS